MGKLDSKTSKRCDELFALDMVYNGTEYIGKKNINKDFNVHWVEITCDPDNVWDEMIAKLKAELERRKALNRPVVEHKHTKGDWKYSTNHGCKDIEGLDFPIAFTSGCDEEEDLANAKLISIAPQLLEIAEMYFDNMKDTDAEGSIPFNITLETLNKLK